VVHRHVLDAISDDRLRLYVVWLPLHDSDLRIRAQEATILFNDPRVHQFWSPTLALPEAYKTQLKLQKSVAWDVFLAFPLGATWTEPVPVPTFLMHNLDELPAEQRLDALIMARELRKMLTP